MQWNSCLFLKSHFLVIYYYLSSTVKKRFLMSLCMLSVGNTISRPNLWLWRSIRSWLHPLSRICTRMPYTGSNFVQWADQKNWPKTLHFRVCRGRGHKGRYNNTVFRRFDEGILRGEGKKNFDPHISPFGARKCGNFSAWQRLTGPVPWQNIGS